MTKRRPRNDCATKGLRPDEYGPPRPRQWHLAVLIEHPGKARRECEVCAKPMWLPASKVAIYSTCSDACRSARSAAGWKERERKCETCSVVFHARRTQISAGIGRYCSRQCIPSDHLSEPENLAKATAGWLLAKEDGRIRFRSGENSASWKGGPAAAKARRRDSGKAAASLRRYRKQHPDKVREFALRRRDRRELGKRLPMGTVKRIGNAQGWRCAICSTGIKNCYHVDHIRPLAKDGKHEPRNIQLTCPTCNVRKSAKDPIDYMRSLGRLL